MKKINFYNFIIIIAAVICAVFLYNAATEFLHGRALERAVSGELAANKVSNKNLVGKVKRIYVEKRYWVPDSLSFDDFEKKLQRSLVKAGFKVLLSSRSIKESTIKGVKESREEVSFLIAERSSSAPIFRLTLIHKVALKPAPAPAVKPIPAPVVEKPAPPRPKIAVVLDDWGYNTKNLDAVLQIDKPLTISILPELPYSTLISHKAKDHGFEVILHMPMEPKAKIKLELITLYTDMNEAEMRVNLSRAFRSVPTADGMNNHEGSKATEDRRLMKVVFGELKKNDMFFLDSLVTNDSACEPLAREAGIKFAKRSVFLDNESDPAYIKKQFEKAIDLALKKGGVVAIGHDRPNTIVVFKEMIPVIEANGIEITYVSNLAR